MATDVRSLRRRYQGAPESLRVALEAACTSSALPRATRRELAHALDALPPPPRPRIGVVPFPVVQPHDGTGLVYRAIASDGPRADCTRLPRDLDVTVRTWLDATFSSNAGGWPMLHVSGPAPGELWEGRSCEAALAVAAVSWWLGLRPKPAALTGALVTPGQVDPVDHVSAKRALLAQHMPGVPLHAGDHSLAVLDAALPTWRTYAATQATRSLRQRSHHAIAALHRHDLDAALEAATQVLTGEADDAARARARWVRGAVRLHRGEGDAGNEDLSAARDLLPAWSDHADDPPDDLVAEELVAWEMIALLDTGRPQAATTLGYATLARLDAAPRRARRWRAITLQVAGSTHRAAIMRDALDEAGALLTERSLGDAALADQRARCLGDLAEVHRRAGDLEAASHTLDAAFAALVDAGPAAITTRAFLDLFRARLDAAAGHPVPEPPQGPIWPTLGHQVLASRQRGHLGELHAMPAVRRSVALQWVVASEAAWHVLHGGPCADAWEVVAADVAAWRFDEAAMEAWRTRLVAERRAEDLKALRRRAPYG